MTSLAERVEAEKPRLGEPWGPPVNMVLVQGLDKGVVLQIGDEAWALVEVNAFEEMVLEVIRKFRSGPA